VGLKEAFMNKIIFALMIFLLTGCMSPKAPITCSEISDRFNFLEKPMELKTSTGFEELSEYIYIYDSVFKFNKDVDTYFLYLELLKKRKIDDFDTNDYCEHINQTIKEHNTTVMLTKLEKIKNDWTDDYSNEINSRLDNKIKFKTVYGCQSLAGELMDYIMTYNLNSDKNSQEIYLGLKNGYLDCLDINGKRR
jgi:hypothetical protein